MRWNVRKTDNYRHYYFQIFSEQLILEQLINNRVRKWSLIDTTSKRAQQSKTFSSNASFNSESLQMLQILVILNRTEIETHLPVRDFLMLTHEKQ